MDRTVMLEDMEGPVEAMEGPVEAMEDPMEDMEDPVEDITVVETLQTADLARTAMLVPYLTMVRITNTILALVATKAR